MNYIIEKSGSASKGGQVLGVPAVEGAWRVREQRRWRWGMFWLVPMVMATGSATVVGQVSVGELEKAIAKARGAFRPITEARRAAARQRVVETAGALERLWTSPDGELDQAAWEAYLGWPSFRKQLEAKQPELAVLRTTIERLFQHRDHLHRKPFTDFRDALVRWFQLEQASRDPQLAAKYGRALDQLQSAAARLARQPDDAAAARQVAGVIGFLRGIEQAAEVVRLVESTFWKDNLEAFVSNRFVAAGLSEPIDQPSKVIHDCILGTSVRSEVTTTGKVKGRTIDSSDAAAVRLTIRGDAFAKTVGWQRSVTVYSNSRTDLCAEVDVFVDLEGLRTSCISAGASTCSHVYALCAPSRLVERIAWRRVAKTKPCAEEVASQKAAARLRAEVAERLEELGKEFESGLDARLRHPLMRRGGWPLGSAFASDQQGIRVRLRHRPVGRPAAATPAPPLDRSSDMAVRLHETFVDNFALTILGGYRMTSDKLAQVLKRLGIDPEKASGKPKATGEGTKSEEPWAITFSRLRPVTVSFRDGKVAFAIRGERFEDADRVVSRIIEMSATYRVEKTDQGARLVREGPVSVAFVGRRGIGPSDILVRDAMKARFERLFQKEIATEGLTLPGRWKAAGTLKLAALASQGGWLSLSWRMVSGSSAPAAGSETASGGSAKRKAADRVARHAR